MINFFTRVARISESSNEETTKKGIMYLCSTMQAFQSFYCLSIGIYLESLFCLCSFLFQLVIFRIWTSQKELSYNLTCLNCILVILSGNLHDSFNVNATSIFLSLPPLICISLVGVKRGTIWTGLSVIVSVALMVTGKYVEYGWGKRAAGLNYEIGLSNLITVPLLVLGIFGYFYHKKKLTETELQLSKDKLIGEKKEKERLLTVLFHDLGRSTSLLSGYLELDSQKSLNPEVKEKVYALTKEIKAILKDTQNLDTQTIKIGPQKVLLLSIFESLKSSFSADLEKKYIDFKFIGNSSAFILGNSSQLTNQVFGNVVSNAIKFSNVRETIKFVAEETNDGDTQIKISNRGSPFIDRTPRKGTNGESGSGRGLNLVSTFANFNGLDFKISYNGKETIAHFFPLKDSMLKK